VLLGFCIHSALDIGSLLSAKPSVMLVAFEAVMMRNFVLHLAAESSWYEMQRQGSCRVKARSLIPFRGSV